jgi:hypothetical protein
MQKLVFLRKFKNSFIAILFIFFFAISFAILLKRHFATRNFLSSSAALMKTTEFFLKDKKDVTMLDVYNIISAILKKGLPLSTLTTFLQNRSEPWASSSLSALTNINIIWSVLDLEACFIKNYYKDIDLHISESVTNQEDLFVIIKKTGKYSFTEEKEYILRALQNEDIQSALTYFEKLSNSEKSSLSAWEKAARERLAFETICKGILLDLCKEPIL